MKNEFHTIKDKFQDTVREKTNDLYKVVKSKK